MPCHSMDSLETCVKIPLEPEILTDVVEKAKDFCLMHGKFSSYISFFSKLLELNNVFIVRDVI